MIDDFEQIFIDVWVEKGRNERKMKLLLISRKQKWIRRCTNFRIFESLLRAKFLSSWKNNWFVLEGNQIFSHAAKELRWKRKSFYKAYFPKGGRG